MKYKILWSFLILPYLASAQTPATSEIGFGYVASGLRTPDNRFQIGHLSLERRPSWAKQKLGLGFQSIWVSDKSMNQTEFSLGPQFIYHIAGDRKLDPFVSISPMWSRSESGSELNTQWHLKYSYGLRYEIKNHWKLSFEMANYRHAAGLFPSPNQERRGGILPTLGLRYVFRKP